jgi:hypothetical protein
MSGIIGVNVYWNLKNVGKIDADKAVEILEEKGFEREDIKWPSVKTAFCRAIKEFNDTRGHRLTRKIKDNKDCLIYGIVDEKVDAENEALTYKKETTARFDKQTGRVDAEGELSQEVCNMYEVYQDKFIGYDIRQFLRVAIDKACGVPKRPSGGIYFVPQTSVETIEAMSAVINELGIGKVYIERIYDGPQERENIWESCSDEIERVVEDVLTSVEKIGKRVSAVETQESKVLEMKNLMGVYQKLLGKEAIIEDIMEKLQEADSLINKKMKELA